MKALVVGLVLGSVGLVTVPAAASADCRVVQHELGEACVPMSPQRVVALDPSTTLATLFEIGTPVVGAVAVGVDQRFPSYLDVEQLHGVEVVGTVAAPDVAAIAALAPDLIIGTVISVEPLFEDLSALAPTVAIGDPPPGLGWRDDVRLVGAVVGASDVVEQRLAELDAVIAALRAEIEAAGSPPTLSVIIPGPLETDYECYWFGDVLAVAGVGMTDEPFGCPDDAEVPPPLATTDWSTYDPVDVIVVLIIDDSVVSVAAAGGTSVHSAGDAWRFGGSVTAAQFVLHDLRSFLVTE